MSHIKPIEQLVIVGGGTAGWLAAAMLASQVPKSCGITVVEASDVGPLGVGESTIPPFVGLLRRLGINEKDFMAQTNGCYKLGIRFRDWKAINQEYFHPFGTIGTPIEHQDFYQCWLRAQALGKAESLMDYSPCAALAKNLRFYHPELSAGLGGSYALHMDAALGAQYFQRLACKKGVARIEGKVVGAERDHRGQLHSLHLESGQKLNGDFFIDCTGFAARLIGAELNIAYTDWSKTLPCDRAIWVKSESALPLRPYTEAKATKHGWVWRIPLKNSTGFGHVYSSNYSSETGATSTLMRALDAKRVSEPKSVAFIPGHRQEFWTHNCLALGLAAGFIEPLESTSIHLIARGVEYFLRYFPQAENYAALSREYNRRMLADFEEIRDFVLLHYITSERTDSPFWRSVKSSPLPESLSERIELFMAQGQLRQGVDDLFRSTSWYAVFEGMGLRPTHFNARALTIDEARLVQELQNHKSAVNALLKFAFSADAAIGQIN